MRTLQILSFLLLCSITSFSQQNFSTHHISIGSGPQQIGLADLNGDNNPDIIVANSNDNVLAWFPHDGYGIYGIIRIIDDHTDDYTGSVITVDLNNDNMLDIVTSSPYSVRWYKNLGNGLFSSSILITDSISGGSKIYAKDLDNDSLVDVLSSSMVDDKIAWYKNLGNDSFGNQQVVNSNADGASSVWAEDIDQDNLIDIISSSKNDNKIAWYKNLGNGIFGSETIISNVTTLPRIALTSDIDNDSLVDILYSNYAELPWKKNMGNGNFAGTSTINSAIGAPRYLSAVDLDNDNDTDIIVPSSLEDTVFWQENLGNGFFGPKQIISSSIAWPCGVSSADLTGDGLKDIVVGGTDENSISVFEQRVINNIHTFELRQKLNLAPVNPRSIHADDLNNDGLLDILVASQDDNTVSWYKNLGNQLFSLREIINANLSEANCVFSADIDNDGLADVISGGKSDFLIWQKNLGNDAFDAPLTISSQIAWGQIKAIDLNNDNLKDVVALSVSGMPTLYWFENLGNGLFGTGNIITSSPDFKAFDFADLNNNGEPDFVYSGSSILSLGFNDGNGNFNPLQNILFPEGADAFEIADFNLDGYNDIIAKGKLTGTTLRVVKWLPNDGTGNFTTVNLIDTLPTIGGYDLFVRDVNNDSLPDILATSSNKIHLIENLGSGNFGSLQDIKDISAFDLYPADLDNDQDIDFVSCVYGIKSKIEWHENTQNNLIDTIIKCAGDSSLIFGVYQTLPGDYMDSLLTSSGSDSILIIRLENYPTYFPVDTVKICEGDFYEFNGQFLTTAGTYYATFQSIHGCDSILELPLELMPAPMVSIDDFNPDSASLHAGAIALPIGIPSGGEYAGAGVTSQGFDPSLTGTGEFWITYSYTDTITNCTGKDSTSITVYDPLGINESVINPVQLFPNPGRDNFTITGSHIQSVQIHTISGKLIKEPEITNRTRIDFNLMGYAKGVYFIRIVNSEEEIIKLLILM